MTGADGSKEGEDGKSPLEGSGMSDEELASRWRARLAQAAQIAKMFGKLPACLQREIDDIVEPSVPWQEHLQLFVAEAAHKSRLDWDQPHRRYTVLDSYAPREVFMGCNVAVYVDTSGSVSQEQLVQAAAETREIIRASGGQIRWICGDADIAKEEWISEDEASKFEGGGGTSFVPLFEHLSENPPKALVIITDTWGTHWNDTPDYPVLWAVYSSARKAGVEVPFGEIVEVEEFAS
jgi:predicted metal-dependent peptidase